MPERIHAREWRTRVKANTLNLPSTGRAYRGGQFLGIVVRVMVTESGLSVMVEILAVDESDGPLEIRLFHAGGAK